jgi:hypothetical protein
VTGNLARECGLVSRGVRKKNARDRGGRALLGHHVGHGVQAVPDGESERPIVGSSWSQFASEGQRFDTHCDSITSRFGCRGAPPTTPPRPVTTSTSASPPPRSASGQRCAPTTGCAGTPRGTPACRLRSLHASVQHLTSAIAASVEPLATVGWHAATPVRPHRLLHSRRRCTWEGPARTGQTTDSATTVGRSR